HREQPPRGTQFGELRPQASPGQILQHQEWLPVAFLYVVDGCNVRMVECGDDPGFLQEAAARLPGRNQRGCEEFQGHQTVELQVSSLVHQAGTTLSELLEHLVVRDVLADYRQGRHTIRLEYWQRLYHRMPGPDEY